MTHRSEHHSALDRRHRQARYRDLATFLTPLLFFSLSVMAPSDKAFGRAGDLTRQSTQQTRDANSQSAGGKDVQVIEPGKIIKRERMGGQQHNYQIRLSADQFFNAIVKQDGIDVMVRVFGPDGKQILEIDSEGREQGQESVSLVTEARGDYRLSVHPKPRRAHEGSYQIRIEELRAATENDRALFEARKLNDEHLKLWRIGKYDEALPLVERALEIRERLLGLEDRDVAQSLNNLAILHYFKGDYAKAEPLCQRALAIREKALGPEHPLVAGSLTILATLYWDKANYAKAEPLCQRALAIWEKTLGPEHPNVAGSLTILATLYWNKGDYARAEPLYQRSLNIQEKALGPEHLGVAGSLANLAILYRNRGDYAKAEPLHQRALAIWEKALGPEHPDVAVSLNNLAILHRDKGDYAKAETLHQRALAIWEKALGPEHPDVAQSLNNLANLYRNKGAYAKAEPLYQRSLYIQEKALGPEHPNVADSLTDLAVFYVAKGDLTQAVSSQSRANSVTEHNLALNLATGSERQTLAYLALSSKEINFTLSLHSQAAQDDPQALNLAFTTLLRRKGRALDVMTDTIARVRRRAAPQDQMLLDQLAEARSRLAALTLKESGAVDPDTYRTRLKPLEEQVEKLEAELGSRSAEFRAQAQPVTLAAVQAALPAGSALIEFAIYTPLELRTEKSRPPRYLAYLLTTRGQPKWVDLGEAAMIDRAADAWRKALRDPNRTDVKQLARAVDRKVMRPVRSLLGEMPGETRRLLIAPDGLLNLIPFAALVDERNKYLIERHAVSYLTSGRDLLRMQTSRPSKNAPLVVANPAFGGVAPGATRAGRTSKNSQVGAQGLARIDSTEVFFQSLPGTEREALAIKAALPEASVFLREQATEAALKQYKAPSLLHIATHGFFLSDQETPPAKTRGVHGDNPLRVRGDNPLRVSDRQLGRWTAKIENPLLRSGLALAGVNEHRGDDDDGVLTAMEAASMDLWGTRLVVLSACDTGVGEVKNGEGVYGLRRALTLAGSETQVMSLWPVLDKETRTLMVGYYKRLLKGEGRGEALRQIQLKMLKDAKLRHPYYWASFIQAGEWANLDGQR